MPFEGQGQSHTTHLVGALGHQKDKVKVTQLTLWELWATRRTRSKSHNSPCGSSGPPGGQGQSHTTHLVGALGHQKDKVKVTQLTLWELCATRRTRSKSHNSPCGSSVPPEGQGQSHTTHLVGALCHQKDKVKVTQLTLWEFCATRRTRSKSHNSPCGSSVPPEGQGQSHTSRGQHYKEHQRQRETAGNQELPSRSPLTQTNTCH